MTASSSSQVGGVEPGTTRHVALKRHTREKVKISLGMRKVGWG